MCGKCGPIPEDVKEAYAEFEQALDKFLVKLSSGPEDKGITVDWVLVTSENFIDEHGGATATGYTARLDQPGYRTKGLMYEVLDQIKANDLTRRILHHDL